MNEAEVKCWTELARMIVVQAGIDYLKVRREILNSKPGQRRDKLIRELEDIKKFFGSKWYRDLTDTNGQWLLEQLDKGFEEMRRTGSLHQISRLERTLGI